MKSIWQVSRKFRFILAVTPIICAGVFQAWAQDEPTITVYAGPRLPENGTNVSEQFIDDPGPLAVDGAGGFYVVSNIFRIYRVDADGTITHTAGSGSHSVGPRTENTSGD